MICSDCGPEIIPHIYHDPEWRENLDWKGRRCEECPRKYPIPKGEPDHVTVGYCACIDWMKWKLSPEGGKQLSAVSAAAKADGVALGKQIEMDEAFATKLNTEERLREGAKPNNG